MQINSSFASWNFLDSFPALNIFDPWLVDSSDEEVVDGRANSVTLCLYPTHQPLKGQKM